MPRPTDTRDGGRAGDRPGKESNLSAEMHTLSGMIGDLETQLDRMLRLNGALQEEVATERKQRIALQGKLDALQEQLRRTERDAAGKENLASEVRQIGQERTRLMELLSECREKLEAASEERRAQDALVARLRASREDALEETQAVETQFERAMAMLAEAKTQIVVLQEEREALKGRLRMSRDKIDQLMEEREQLLHEVEQSRAALDEIRRTLVDACAVPVEGTVEGGAGLGTIS